MLKDITYTTHQATPQDNLMIRRIAYLLHAAKFFVKNSRRIKAPKGIRQNVRYYYTYPYSFICYMRMVNKDWPQFKSGDTHI